MKMSFVGILATVLPLLVGSDAAWAYKGIHSSGHGPEKLNYDSLYQAARPLSESPEGSRLVIDCVTAYGGRAHLEQLTTMVLHYRMVQSLSGDTADLWKYLAPGPKLRKTRHLPGLAKELILNDARAWQVVRDTVVELTGSDYYGQLYSYEVLRMPLPLAEAAPGDLRYGTREGDSLGYIYWKARDSLLVIVVIDPDNKLIMACEGVVESGSGTQVYVNRLAHYREIETYLLPQQIVDVSLGLELGTSHLQSVEINPPLSDKMFSPHSSTRRAH